MIDLLLVKAVKVCTVGVDEPYRKVMSDMVDGTIMGFKMLMTDSWYK